MRKLKVIVQNWFLETGMEADYVQVLTDVILFFGVIMLSIIAFYFTRKILLNFIDVITKKSKTDWDDVLVKNKFFTKLSWIIPGYILWATAPSVFDNYGDIIKVIQTLLSIYMIIILILAVNAFLNTLVDVYSGYAIAKDIPIKGYVQVIKILVVLAAVIVIIAQLLGYNPMNILGGMGAFTAVLLLVFKDPIMGFVGGVQLTANNMLKPGDWISMPKYGVDGTVIDIALTTVKVQNWDKTISTIPTYSLISDSFKNWKGMEETKGRRIKRSVFIDLKTVKFVNEDMLSQFKKFDLLRDYLEEKEKELREYNSKNNITSDTPINGRSQTNIGVFRAYLQHYLEKHPKIRKDLTLMVKQNAPSEKGVPIQIYVFSNVIDWVEYEAIQSDIFDHVFAIIPYFQLEMFQNPSGNDFKRLVN